MKIAHLTTVDMSLRYLVFPQLLAAAIEGEAVGISAPGPYVDEIELAGIRHIPLDSSTRGNAPLADLRSALELWRILKAERFDVLHTHNPKPGVYGRIVGRLAGVPVVVNTIHGLYASDDSPRFKRGLVYSLEWLASRFSHAELVQSPEDFELLRRLRITPRSRTILLGNGVDLDRFNPDSASARRDEVRAELGVGDEQIVVGMVGRLVLEKGIPELIEAAESLNGDEFVLVIVGPHDPDKSDAIPDELMSRGVRAGVRFLGMRTDVERLYGGFDLFVLPSHREGFPRAAMEAAASGLPVVATDIRGCRQVVDDGETGFLFPVGDAPALAHAIRTLGSDQTRLRAFGAASARKARREFDEEDVVEKVMSTYRTLAMRRGLSWKIADVEDVALRPARAGDEYAIAELHRQMIATGFLSSLGHRFLRVLYEAMIGDDGCAVVVAESNGVVVGFIAGTVSTGRLYKRFLRDHLFKAALSMFPAILKPSMWKRLYESFRYGSYETRFDAELLSMAVAPAARRRQVGKRLVGSLLSWAEDQGIEGMKVVVAESNRPATALYNSCGFVEGRRVEVHADTASWEFIWSA